METRFLKTFLHVVETGSIAGAARKENVTSSAVVQRLRALESDLGQVLVRRAGHSMQPTEAGRAILEAAKQVVDVTESLQGLAQDQQDVGTIRVGVIHSMITGLMPEILSSMELSVPMIKVEVIPGQSSHLFQRLKEKTLDGAIMIEPPFMLPKEYVWHELRQDPLVVLTCSAETSEDPIELLKRAPLIRYDRKHWGGRFGDRYLKKNRLNPNDRHELDSLEAIAVLVDRGLGISLVPDWLPPWPEGLSLRKLPLPDAPCRKIGIIYAHSANNRRLMASLADHAQKAAQIKGEVARMHATNR
ncbi:LysR family transcriptional regulator [Metarhizobium album]|uniref:LysR family transcriptional regulator n=1 Tax=Metarhizobium album TaxID=2182425 RepID=A0A2U2DKA7_9HYPH|nr:LysR family transcriptional regulator [Rhizobium album]PWE53723.1 LysR family transcriptional regulator [Rhizobium album]